MLLHALDLPNVSVDPTLSVTELSPRHFPLVSLSITTLTGYYLFRLIGLRGAVAVAPELAVAR